MNGMRRRALWGGLLTLALVVGCDVAPNGNSGGDNGTDPDSATGQVGSGTARVSGTIRSADVEDDIPLAGVRVELGDAWTLSSVDGTFELLNTLDGTQTLLCDGTAVGTDEGHYGQFATAMELTEHEDRLLTDPVYLPFVPDDSAGLVDPASSTTVSGDGGVTLEIPPGGARVGQEEYDGPISVLAIAPGRTPASLPARFDGRVEAIISIQPIDVRFPVEVPVTFPQTSGGTTGISRMALWWFDPDAGEFSNVGFAESDGDTIYTTIGGARGGGWYVLAELDFTLRRPCDGSDGSEARACYQSALELLDEIRQLRQIELPGAVTVFGRLNAALAERGSSVDRAQAVLQISSELFEIASTAVLEYQALYRDLGDLQGLDPALAAAGTTCLGYEVCDGNWDERQDAHSDIAQLSVAISANVEAFAAQFDRLAAAAGSLAVYYGSPGLLTTDTLGAFHQIAGEFNEAYDGFEPYTSPPEAYDALVEALTVMENTALAFAQTVSAPLEDQADTSGVSIQRVCPNLGTTQLGTIVDGAGSVQLGDATGTLDGDCIVLVADRELGLAAAPVSEKVLMDELRPPAVWGLAREMTFESLALGRPGAGTLSDDAPVAAWGFTAADAQSLQVSFSGGIGTLAGLAAEDGVIQMSRDGGFDVVNLGSGGSFELRVFSTAAGVASPYTFSVDSPADEFAVGSPVVGAFDVDNRAAALMFEGDAGEQILVEKRCCDPFGIEFTYGLLGPDGVSLSPRDYSEEDPGIGNELYELSATGLHRVVLAPFEGRFPDYEMLIHRVPVNEPVACALDTETTGVFDDIGERLVFTFTTAGNHDIILLEGVSATGPTPLLYSLTASDGTTLDSDELLYFNGSSYATRDLGVVAEGTYTLEFRALLDAEVPLGSFVFRLTTATE